MESSFTASSTNRQSLRARGKEGEVAGDGLGSVASSRMERQELRAARWLAVWSGLGLEGIRASRKPLTPRCFGGGGETELDSLGLVGEI